jgi:hypothetical protein
MFHDACTNRVQPNQPQELPGRRALYYRRRDVPGLEELGRLRFRAGPTLT